MKTNITKTSEELDLRNWFEKKRESGEIVDVKFFPGKNRNVPLRQAVKDVWSLISDSENDALVDITDETL